jgi:hypothetical protein
MESEVYDDEDDDDATEPMVDDVCECDDRESMVRGGGRLRSRERLTGTVWIIVRSASVCVVPRSYCGKCLQYTPPLTVKEGQVEYDQDSQNTRALFCNITHESSLMTPIALSLCLAEQVLRSKVCVQRICFFSCINQDWQINQREDIFIANRRTTTC